MGLTRSDYCIQEIGKDWVITLEANGVWGVGDEQEGKRGISVMQFSQFLLSLLLADNYQKAQGVIAELPIWRSHREL